MKNALDIKLMGDDGKEYKLSQFSGRKIVLYFYPKDNTMGCSIQSRKYSELLDDFKRYNAIVIGCSPQPIESKKSFKEKKQLDQLLLADTEFKLSEALGVAKSSLITKGISRSTFIFNEVGEIVYEFHNVKFKDDATNALNFLIESRAKLTK